MSVWTQEGQRKLLRGLPRQLLLPVGLLPPRISQRSLIFFCNRLFAAALAAGDLGFLERRIVSIEAEDAGVGVRLSAERGRLIVPALSQRADVSIRGSTYELLLLASRREDADTLFFQRRLRMEGCTELGLNLKNFLDAWEPPAALRVFQQFADAYLTRAGHG